MKGTARATTAEPAVGDAELFRRLKHGDVSALGALYDRYALDVRTFAPPTKIFLSSHLARGRCYFHHWSSPSLTNFRLVFAPGYLLNQVRK